MRVTTSVITGGFSGAAGDVVAANWKGRLYVRRRVIPANPQSAGQVSQRNAFSRCVDCFQHFPADIKAHLDKVGADSSLSGFNSYMSDSVKEERASHHHRIMPPNRYAETLSTFALAEGAASGQILVTWAKGAYGASDKFDIYVRKQDGAGPEHVTPWTQIDTSAGTMDDETFTITGLTAATPYAVAMIPDEGALGVFGGGDSGVQASKA